MKIIITTQGDSPDSEVDPRFGRAQNFLVYDTETDAYTAVSNTQNLQAAQGAGIQAGRTVTDAGAQAVLTGNCGPKAFRVLNEAGIKVFIGVTGTAREAVEAYQKGELTEATSANVEGHW
jgi:predicted Fe-Mo cluster-binding NifX family protein